MNPVVYAVGTHSVGHVERLGRSALVFAHCRGWRRLLRFLRSVRMLGGRLGCGRGGGFWRGRRIFFVEFSLYLEENMVNS